MEGFIAGTDLYMGDAVKVDTKQDNALIPISVCEACLKRFLNRDRTFDLNCQCDFTKPLFAVMLQSRSKGSIVESTVLSMENTIFGVQDK